MTVRICLSVTALCSVALFAAPAAAQPQTTSPPVFTIRTFGGLLGQVEGFCEDPGGTFDWNLHAGAQAPPNPPPPSPPSPPSPPLVLGAESFVCDPANGGRKSRWLGGSLGVSRQIAEARPAAGDWLILSGDNRGARFGDAVWDAIAALRPQVVAVGPEDIVRAMNESSSARAVGVWMAGNPNVPFLASNVAVRQRRPDLNSVEDGRFTLHLDEDDSVPWIASVKVDAPRLSAPAASLEEFAQPGRPAPEQRSPARQVEFKAGKEDEDATVTFSPALRPDRWYRLTITDAGSPVAAFVFKTDAALTPITSAVAELDGFPVRGNADGSWLVVSLLDPGTTARAATSAWTWTEAGADYEMVFLDPKKTLAAAIGLLKRRQSASSPQDAPSVPGPGIVLVSSLSDDDTTSLLAEFPQVRFVILHPESRLLARAAAAGKRTVKDTGGTSSETRFSGDLGFASIVDQQYPEATRIIVRPEWFGETLITMTAEVSANPFDAREHSLRQPRVYVDVVPGAELKAVVQAPTVEYSAVYDTQTVLTGRAPLYHACTSTAGGLCGDFRAIWSEPAQLAAVIGDALRQRVAADISVIPQDLIDPDYSGYVKRRVESVGTDWISRYVLERVVFASPRIVKASVSGADLAAKLAKAIKDDGTLCISGIGAACPSTIDADHAERLTINGRRVNARLFYSVAMPDYLAEALEVSHDDDGGVDVVDAMHQHLAGGFWQLPAGQSTRPLNQRLEERRSRKLQGYFTASTLDAGLTYIRPRDPANGTGVRRNLGLPFSGAEDTKATSLGLDSDLGLIDAQSFAIRMPATLQYARRREPEKVTFESDEFSTGLRFDWKYRMTRPFIGYFIDGQLRGHPASLTASRKLNDASREGFQISEAARFSTAYVIEPRRYRHIAAGLEFVELKAFPIAPQVSVNVRKLGARWTKGSESNVPIGLTIGGVDQPFDRLLSEGEGALLNEYFAANPDTFSKDVQFDIRTERLPQTRLQADADGELTWKVKDREYTGDVKVRYRWYETAGPARSDFQLSQDFRLELKLGVPLVWRFKLVPSYVYQRVKIEADANNAFRYNKIDIKLSLPIVIRYGQGRLVK